MVVGVLVIELGGSTELRLCSRQLAAELGFGSSEALWSKGSAFALPLGLG